MRKISVFLLLKGVSLFLLVAYAAITTIAVIKMQPKTILVGIDGKNTRVIREDKDSLLEAEKLGFLFGFIDNYYKFDSSDYLIRQRESKSRMSDAVWRTRQAEFAKNEEHLKSGSLAQRYDLLQMKELDNLTYEFQLKIKSEVRGTVSEFPMTVRLKLKKKERSVVSPFPIELEVLDEKRTG